MAGATDTGVAAVGAVADLQVAAASAVAVLKADEALLAEAGSHMAARFPSGEEISADMAAVDSAAGTASTVVAPSMAEAPTAVADSTVVEAATEAGTDKS